MQKSKHLESFKRLKESGYSPTLIGNRAIVEEIPDEELKSKSGIILPAGDKNQIDGIQNNRPCFVRVLDVADTAVDHEVTEDDVEVKPGDILLVGGMAISFFSAFCGLVSTTGNQLGIMVLTESNIHMVFKGEEQYEKVATILGDSVRPREAV